MYASFLIIWQVFVRLIVIHSVSLVCVAHIPRRPASNIIGRDIPTLVLPSTLCVVDSCTVAPCTLSLEIRQHAYERKQHLL